MTTVRAIDLRSDTVTQPDEMMRVAMSAAEVGDDVLDHDPTMRRLEDEVAALVGMEAALWVPSGTMGNLIALMLHLNRGDRFLAARGSHVLEAELGSAAWLAGGMPHPLEWTAGPGRFAAEDVRAMATPSAPYYALRTRLLCLENTHNFAGGAVTPPDEHARLVSAAKEAGLRVHLDGARLWNAAVALGVPPAALAVGVDTVQVCLSKGLGAPVGSVLAGPSALVREGRRVRKMLGGGVRQGGVLAAAGILALERMADLEVDHANARSLADGLTELGWAVVRPETNIVLAEVPDTRVALAMLDQVGVLAAAVPGGVRFVTHRDVPTSDIGEALRRISGQVSGRSAAEHPVRA
ncbi:threonine aldolase family protein [Actinokineospora pegani]|uniref:threonine aldolase family protein n=1 Tax=Actinokineospora pegani TaxID=2654637 RepID=UPI0012E99FDB|nr:GntG family PLP-dependent aldolase [Actinokineospora pegani]